MNREDVESDAEAAFARTDLAEATRLYEELVRRFPDSAAYHARLGQIAKRRVEYDLAIRHLRSATELSPGNTLYWYELGLMLFKRGMVDEWILCQGCLPTPEEIEAKQTPMLDQAYACFERAVALEPRLVDAYLQMARTLAEKKRLAEALPLFEFVLTLDPSNSVAHGAIGTILLMTAGASEEVISHFVEAVRLDPYAARSHHNLGLTLMRLGKYAEAEQSFWRAALLDPRNASYQCNLGLSRTRLGRWDEALQAFGDGLGYAGASLLLRNSARVAQAVDRAEVAHLMVQAASTTDCVPRSPDPSRSVPVAREAALRTAPACPLPR
jgi:tetratricopeptide (TPR) repeat protein